MENKEKQEIAGRIIETGSELFRRYGMRMITMDEIARQMGVSKKTIYAHFADKNELVQTVTQRSIDNIQENCTQIKKKAADAIEETFLIMLYLDGLFRNMNPVVLAEMEKYHCDAFEIFRHHRENFVRRIVRDNLLWGMKEELYHPDLQVEILTRFRMDMSTLCFRQDLYPRDKFPMNEVQRTLMEHYLHGIATQKGQKLISKYKQKYSATNNRLAT